MAETLLEPLVGNWLGKIKLGLEFKKKEFQDDADEAFRFFAGGAYDWIYTQAQATRNFSHVGGNMPKPTFGMTVNKAAEIVDLFGPALYHRNPTRQVTPRQAPEIPPELLRLIVGAPPAPMLPALDGSGVPVAPPLDPLLLMQAQTEAQNLADRARALLLEHYLNWTPAALDLRGHSRLVVADALVKGLGLWWTETWQPPGAPFRMVGSFHGTCDELVIDPDATCLRDAKWVARRCAHPVWQVEDDYGLPRGTLKGHAKFTSYSGQAETAAQGAAGLYDQKRGLTCDTLVYWKIWTKMGGGGRLSNIESGLRQILDSAFGEYCYLAVAADVPYPLNVPPNLLAAASEEATSAAAREEINRRSQWPTPQWADGGWPFTPLAFHWVPGKLWPYGHLRPAIGELLFLNWAYSFLATKVWKASRDFIAVAKSAGETIKARIADGADYTVLEVDALHESIDKVVQFLQFPGFNQDIYTVIQGVTRLFEQRTGLTELLHGQSSTQERSATASDLKADYASIRPDDMAEVVEAASSELARREAFAARWHLEVGDVTPVLGQAGALVWQRLVTPASPAEIVFNLQYRVESGSTRKPNRARDAANWQGAAAQLLQPLFAYAQATGDVGPFNALLAGWAKTMEMDAGPLLLKAPPAPPPMPALPPGDLPPVAPPPAEPSPLAV